MAATELAKVLAKQGRKKSWLASRLQVDRSTVTRWVKGESVPRDRHKREIANLLGVPEDELF